MIGGLYSLPADSEEWEYGLTAFYAALGVPLMGVAMGTIASFFIDTGSVEDTIEQIRLPITEKEVHMLTEFGKFCMKGL